MTPASTAFNSLAADYSRLWTATARGQRQREQVWRVIDPLFRRCDSVLDLGCGIGDDALHLSKQGIDVHAIDASEKMIEIAQARGVNARLLRIEELDQLRGTFSGAISDFGALNCIESLQPIADELSRLVRFGGVLALCVMGRFAPLETLHFLARLDLSNARRRWNGVGTWRGTQIYYHSSADMRKAFANGFSFQRRVATGGGDHQLYIFRRMRSGGKP